MIPLAFPPRIRFQAATFEISPSVTKGTRDFVDNPKALAQFTRCVEQELPKLKDYDIQLVFKNLSYLGNTPTLSVDGVSNGPKGRIHHWVHRQVRPGMLKASMGILIGVPVLCIAGIFHRDYWTRDLSRTFKDLKSFPRQLRTQCEPLEQFVARAIEKIRQEIEG